MANIKSAKKDIRRSEGKRIANTAWDSKVKNSIKRCEAAIKANDKETATSELKTVISNIDKACSKGIVKKNTCARQKARLNKKVKEMSK